MFDPTTGGSRRQQYQQKEGATVVTLIGLQIDALTVVRHDGRIIRWRLSYQIRRGWVHTSHAQGSPTTGPSLQQAQNSDLSNRLKAEWKPVLL